jgi:hypothetical protein
MAEASRASSLHAAAHDAPAEKNAPAQPQATSQDHEGDDMSTRTTTHPDGFDDPPTVTVTVVRMREHEFTHGTMHVQTYVDGPFEGQIDTDDLLDQMQRAGMVGDRVHALALVGDDPWRKTIYDATRVGWQHTMQALGTLRVHAGAGA